MADEVYISRILALSLLSCVTLAKLTCLIMYVSSVVKWDQKMDSLVVLNSAWHALKHLLKIIIIIIIII